MGGKPHHSFVSTARALWGIIDDIDTIDDVFKGDDEGYRLAVRRKVGDRFNYGSSDGYALEIFPTAMPDGPQLRLTNEDPRPSHQAQDKAKKEPMTNERKPKQKTE